MRHEAVFGLYAISSKGTSYKIADLSSAMAAKTSQQSLKVTTAYNPATKTLNASVAIRSISGSRSEDGETFNIDIDMTGYIALDDVKLYPTAVTNTATLEVPTDLVEAGATYTVTDIS